ncbi:MAG TPA: hypothetical protein VMR70_01130 [Flavisolibacter sp.]|nr:hypothetical protein [Flavisolibacter sp.]
MKQVMLVVVLWSLAFSGFSQSHEAQQLLLNWEKLAQLKTILNNMYNGYRVLDAGYTKIKDISQGNYQLHQVFLDGLLQVSPTVRNYKRVADIIRHQKNLLQEGKEALAHLKNTGCFSADECVYMENVYQNLLKQSMQDLDELFLVLATGQLRMSDDERIASIDRIYDHMEDKWVFLRSFNNSTKVLALQRQQERAHIKLSKKLHGIE